MNCKVYYRGYTKLHQIDVADVESPEQAIAMVRIDLFDQGEVYRTPVLALIDGGKK